SGRKLGQLLRPRNAGVHYHLQISQAGAIVHFEKGKAFGIPTGPHPPFDRDLPRLRRGQNMFDQYAHEMTPKMAPKMSAEKQCVLPTKPRQEGRLLKTVNTLDKGWLCATEEIHLSVGRGFQK